MLMWAYTEDGSLEEEDNEKDEKDEKKTIKGSSSTGTDSTETSADRRSLASANTSVDKAPVVAAHKKADEHAQHVFLFSLTAPKPSSPKKPLLFDKS